MSRTVVHAIRSNAFAGVERYVVELATELDHRGWTVHVIGGSPERMSRELPSSVSHRVASTTIEVARQLTRLGRSPLVHAHMTAAEGAAVLTRPLTRARIVSTRHFADPRGRGWVARVLGRGLRRGIDAEIAISDFVAHAVGGNLKVIRNGVRNSDVGDPVRRAQSRTVLMLQRLEAEKSTDVGLRGFAESGLVRAGWRLKVAGGGSQTGSLKELSVSLGLEASTDWLGPVEHPQRLLDEAAIFLAPAPAEPFGLAVAEAMASGLPIVAARGGGHLETVAEAGMLFEPGQHVECAQALKRLGEDRLLRDELGRKARARQRATLSLAGHVDRIVETYDAVLA